MTIFELINVKATEIDEIIDKKDEFYLSFPIKKSSGKLRWIDAPQGKLKEIQYKILYKLLYKFKPHRCATGFVLGKGVKDGALQHLGSRIILTMDIHNFFPSLKFYPMVVYTLEDLIKKVRVNNNEEVVASSDDIKKLADILTYKGALPQGSPASPALANVYCYRMDQKLQLLAEEFGKEVREKIIYTRYADDMTFSCTNKDIQIGELCRYVNDVVKSYELELNFEKTRIARPHQRMTVTGIVINDTLGVPKWKRKNLRAKIYNLISSEAKITQEDMLKLRGQVEWIRQLHPLHGIRFLNQLGKIPLQD